MQPTPEERRSPQVNPPKDYLVDHYAVLGVPRFADHEQVKVAFRTTSLKYHPDVYAHLTNFPEEFKRAAAQRLAAATTAWEVLSDSDKRGPYDQELRDWKGPVSKNGEPILVLGRKRIEPLQFLGDPAAREEEIRWYEEQARLMTGFNPELHSKLEAEMSDSASPGLRAAYRRSLETQQSYLALLGDRYEAEIGASEGEIGIPTLGQLEDTRARISRATKGLESTVAVALLDVQAGRILLEGPKGQQIGADIAERQELALADLQAQASKEIQRLAGEAERFATEGDEVLRKRLACLDITYRPEATPPAYFPSLILVLHIDEKASTALHATRTNEGDELRWTVADVTEFDVHRLSDPDYQRTLAKASVNLVEVRFSELDFRDVLEAVLTQHTSKLPS